MSKNELEKLLEAYIPGTGEDWKQSILDVMVAAYNRALDDVQEELGRTVEYGWVERPFEFVKEDLESLKI